MPRLGKETEDERAKGYDGVNKGAKGGRPVDCRIPRYLGERCGVL